jgi:hypothetical protein
MPIAWIRLREPVAAPSVASPCPRGPDGQAPALLLAALPSAPGAYPGAGAAPARAAESMASGSCSTGCPARPVRWPGSRSGRFSRVEKPERLGRQTVASRTSLR